MSAALLSGCATLPDGRRWGEDAALFPGWARVRRAAARAAASPATWAPLAGAAVLQVERMDERISDWASDRTPVFGSTEGAEKAGDVIRDTMDAALLASFLATPSGGEPGSWAAAKVKGGAVEAAALLFADTTVDILKRSTGRTRPNHSNRRSFPSRHSAAVSLDSTLIYQNVRCMDHPEAGETVIGVGLAGISALGAWSRVERKAHYPSDVLAGIGLGHFLGRFFLDAFLGLEAENVIIDVDPEDGGVAFGLRWEF